MSSIQTISHHKKDIMKKLKKQKKEFKAQINCLCKRDCCGNIDVERQREIFENYSKLRKWSAQTQFLRMLVSKKPIKENPNPVINLKKRANLYNYHLISENGSLVEVCLSFFTNVIQINRKKVFRAVSSQDKNSKAIELRGSGRKNRVRHSDRLFLKGFFEKCVTYESCLDSSVSDSKYLHPRLNMRKLYQLYNEECVFKKRVSLSETIFRRIFKQEYNLKFVKWLKPNCQLCNKGELVRSSEKKLEHMAVTKNVKEQLFDSVKIALDITEKTEVFTFEIQKPLELPFLDLIHVFEKRQLWYHCFCVYDEVRHITYCYVWDESIAGRGPEIIASCLYKHFSNYVPKETQKIKLFCDPQHGENRNMEITLMLKRYMDYAGSDNLSSIEQHFFVEGHTFNSCNRIFDTFRRKMKPNEIFIPKQLTQFITQQNRGGKNFIVTEMSHRDFYSCKSISDLLSDKTETLQGEKICWSKFQKITYDRENSYSFKVTEYGADKNVTSVIFFNLKCNAAQVFLKTKLTYFYSEPPSISKSKYDDLQQLIRHIDVPHEYRVMVNDFYQSLKYIDDNSIKDYALATWQSSNDNSDDDYDEKNSIE